LADLAGCLADTARGLTHTLAEPTDGLAGTLADLAGCLADTARGLTHTLA
jgi:hypothetical protein